VERNDAIVAGRWFASSKIHHGRLPAVRAAQARTLLVCAVTGELVDRDVNRGAQSQ